MRSCTQCGHQLGVGRFCTNCGAPVPGGGAHAAWRTDTAERQPVAAPAPSRPEPPADDVRPLPPLVPEPPRHREREPVAWLPWVAGFALLAVLALVGALLLFSGGGDPAAVDELQTSQEPRTGGERSGGTPGDSAPESETGEPSGPGPAEDLAPTAEVSAPPPAPASRDLEGAVVQYVAANLVDGNPGTCWRMPGDGTGASITFRFDDPVRLSQVGLVNGYAKRSTDGQGILDWYAGNRRIRSVEWTFEDGTVVTQDLQDTTEMQTVDLDDVETEAVTLRLLEVTPPGPGRASRDYTPISDVRIVGATVG